MHRKTPFEGPQTCLAAFVAAVALIAGCSAAKTPAHSPANDFPPLGNVDTAPAVARRFVRMQRQVLVDSEPHVWQAALCEPGRIGRLVGQAKSDTLTQWVLRNVWKTAAESLAVERVLESFGARQFEAGGPLCKPLIDLVVSETPANGAAPDTLTKAERELLRKMRTETFRIP